MVNFFPRLAERYRHHEKGATAVEYGIMVALIAVVIIIAVTALGGTYPNEVFDGHRCLHPGCRQRRWDLLQVRRSA